MKNFIAIFLAVILLPAWALAEPVEIIWKELVDEAAQDFEDPFKALSTRQLADVSRVVRLRARLEGDGVSAENRPKLLQQLQSKEEAIEEAGIDLALLLSQRWAVAEKRKAAAWAVNPDLDGRQVSIRGYLLLGRGVSEETLLAYLVPEVGMCSHVPPPPPNQLLRLELPEAAEFPDGRYTAVELTGQMTVKHGETTAHVIDGHVGMNSAWSLDVSEMRALAGTQAKPVETAPTWPRVLTR